MYYLAIRLGVRLSNPTLEDLVGKTIKCQGFTHDYTFIMSKCEEVVDQSNMLGAESNSTHNDVSGDETEDPQPGSDH